jgi:hypothetical protein
LRFGLDLSNPDVREKQISEPDGGQA